MSSSFSKRKREEIFSLVKVTYDYFRCEDLLYIGTEEEIEKIITHF